MDVTAISHDWPLILAYHSVSAERRDSLSVRVEDFDRQMSWLRHRGYRSMTLGDFTSEPVERGDRIVIITFDDGYADNHTFALPVLRRYGFVATVFLVSDYVDTDRMLQADVRRAEGGSEPNLFRMLSWDQIVDLATHGIELGSHSCTHPRELTALPEEQCWAEIARSRTDLQERLGREVVSFCYPRGNLNADVIRMVERAGYRCAVVTPTRPGIPLGPYTLRRIGIYHSNSMLAFWLKMQPFARRNYERLLRFR